MTVRFPPIGRAGAVVRIPVAASGEAGKGRAEEFQQARIVAQVSQPT